MTREQKLIEKIDEIYNGLSGPIYKDSEGNYGSLKDKINELVEEVVEQRKEIQLLKDNIKNL